MDLNELRGQIDKIDKSLLSLFLSRMRLSDEVADYKKRHGLAVYNAEREKEILDRVTDEAGDMNEYARLFFIRVFELSRARQDMIISESQQKKEQGA